ncbi:hypothetical protein HMI56_001017 [Coelomomyces lativittatus]|nr:hypothetical protein HMI56_001017 [Coelomomyces lativittatus]
MVKKETDDERKQRKQRKLETVMNYFRNLAETFLDVKLKMKDDLTFEEEPIQTSFENLALEEEEEEEEDREEASFLKPNPKTKSQ